MSRQRRAERDHQGPLRHRRAKRHVGERSNGHCKHMLRSRVKIESSDGLYVFCTDCDKLLRIEPPVGVRG